MSRSKDENARSPLPTVTVVIPAFNSRDFISETLDSVFALDYPRELLDLIVVDDGSTDGTPELVRARLSGSPIASRLIQQSNAGPSCARNCGVRAARGEWIQFLDADDLLLRSKLVVQGRAAAESGQEVAIVYSDWARLRFSDGAFRVAEEATPRIGREVLLDLIASDSFLQLASLIVRKRWFERVGGFDPTMRLIEDVNLMLRVSIAGGVFTWVDTGQPSALYRQVPGSLSRTDGVAFQASCAHNARLVEDHLTAQSGTLSQRQKKVLLAIYGAALRNFAPCDHARFDELWRHVQRLDTSFIPEGQRGFRWLARVVGYPRAESLAIAARGVRGRLRAR